MIRSRCTCKKELLTSNKTVGNSVDPLAGVAAAVEDDEARSGTSGGRTVVVMVVYSDATWLTRTACFVHLCVLTPREFVRKLSFPPFFTGQRVSHLSYLGLAVQSLNVYRNYYVGRNTVQILPHFFKAAVYWQKCKGKCVSREVLSNVNFLTGLNQQN